MSMKIALRSARQFGAEAQANTDLPSWSKDDREDIASYYGKQWSDIPESDRELLLIEYRKGEQAEKVHGMQD